MCVVRETHQNLVFAVGPPACMLSHPSSHKCKKKNSRGRGGDGAVRLERGAHNRLPVKIITPLGFAGFCPFHAHCSRIGITCRTLLTPMAFKTTTAQMSPEVGYSPALGSIAALAMALAAVA